MKKLSYQIILIIVLVFLIINLIPVFLFSDKIVISTYSFPPIAIMAMVVFNGIVACILKHKGNFLMIRKYRSSIFFEDKDYTFTDEYEKEFRWMLLVYSAVIPFYIPIIAFAKNWAQTSWTLLVYFVPQAIFVAHMIYQTVQEAKNERLKQEQLEKEKKEQERREELGYWK